jgi:hypothetical protein
MQQCAEFHFLLAINDEELLIFMYYFRDSRTPGLSCMCIVLAVPAVDSSKLPYGQYCMRNWCDCLAQTRKVDEVKAGGARRTQVEWRKSTETLS